MAEKLSRREAIVLREFARNPGITLSIYDLAAALYFPDVLWETKLPGHRLPKACDYTYDVLFSIKAKFGRDVIINEPRRGYRLRDGALGGAS